MTIASLRLYDGDGSLLGALPDDMGFQVGIEFSEVGALSLDYEVTGVNADLLSELREVALIDRNGAEVKNGRFVILSVSRDRLTTNSMKVIAKSYFNRLDRAIVELRAGAAAKTVSRKWASATPGFIMKEVIDDALSRGALAGMSYDFTATADSAGVPWPTTFTLEQNARTPILDVARYLSAHGLAYFETHGRVLSAYAPDHFGADRTTQANPVVLFSGDDLTSAPETTDATKLTSDVLVEGSNGLLVRRVNTASRSAFGRLESGIAASGVADLQTLNIIGDQGLSDGSRVGRQLTVGIALDTTQPLSAYTTGDYVFTYTAEGLERVRVRQVTLSKDAAGIFSATSVLGDRFFEREVRLAQLIALTLGRNPTGNQTQVTAPPSLTGTVTQTLAPGSGEIKTLTFSHTIDGNATHLVPGALEWRYNGVKNYHVTCGDGGDAFISKVSTIRVVGGTGPDAMTEVASGGQIMMTVLLISGGQDRYADLGRDKNTKIGKVLQDVGTFWTYGQDYGAMNVSAFEPYNPQGMQFDLDGFFHYVFPPEITDPDKAGMILRLTTHVPSGQDDSRSYDQEHHWNVDEVKTSADWGDPHYSYTYLRPQSGGPGVEEQGTYVLKQPTFSYGALATAPGNGFLLQAGNDGVRNGQNMGEAAYDRTTPLDRSYMLIRLHFDGTAPDGVSRLRAKIEVYYDGTLVVLDPYNVPTTQHSSIEGDLFNGETFVSLFGKLDPSKVSLKVYQANHDGTYGTVPVNGWGADGGEAFVLPYAPEFSPEAVVFKNEEVLAKATTGTPAVPIYKVDYGTGLVTIEAAAAAAIGDVIKVRYASDGRTKPGQFAKPTF